MIVRSRSVRGAAAIAVLALACTTGALAQRGSVNGEWRTYGGDLGATRYAPLDQIDAANFSKLQVAWRFSTENLGRVPEINLQMTPLVVNGVMYMTGGTRRSFVALDAATGEVLWIYRLDEGARAAASSRPLSGRNVAYWTDGRGTEHVYFVTVGYQLVGLDAKTGRPLPGFGSNGIIDLKLDNDHEVEPVTGGDVRTGDWGLNSGPVIGGDVIVIGAAHANGSIWRSFKQVKGYVRGYDVRTGKRLWIFHTIPQQGEFGNETWQKDSWATTGNVGMWTQPSIDEELGLAYLPLEAGTGDYYGGHRPGNNLFAESLVAVELRTGKRVWHYQFVHHGIWDYDLPSPPVLVDLVVDGKPVKAVAQPSKQGFLYVLDRRTGTPVWPIEERPVPQTRVPGEWTSPTQPFPTRPAPFERQSPIKPEDIIDFTPALRTEAEQVLSRYVNGPMFTPAVAQTENGPLGTLMLPGSAGGANWPGGSFDPETNMFYLFSTTQVRLLTLAPRPEQSTMDYILISGRTVNVQGLPLVKPPWGRITAYDLNKGEIVWQVPHGATPDNVRNHPALKGVAVPATGAPPGLLAGTLVTKTLLVSGDPHLTTSGGVRGSWLRAYNKATGAQVGALPLPAPQTGSPMTYMLNGRQYLVVAIGTTGHGAEIVAFAMPSATPAAAPAAAEN